MYYYHIGLPTKNGTMVVVISTYIILVLANVVLFREDGDKKNGKDILQPRCKTMDKVTIDQGRNNILKATKYDII